MKIIKPEEGMHNEQSIVTSHLFAICKIAFLTEGHFLAADLRFELTWILPSGVKEVTISAVLWNRPIFNGKFLLCCGLFQLMDCLST